MPFVRKKVESFPWPIEISKPSEEKPGEFETSSFTIIFKRLAKSKLEKFGEMNEVKALEQVVTGWSDITDESGEQIPFSTKTLKEFGDDIDFITAVMKAYQDFYQGAQAKN